MGILSGYNSPTTTWRPLRGYLFEVIFPTIAGTELTVSKQVLSVKLPSYDVQDLRKYRVGVQRIGFPNTQDIGTLDFTILETQDLVVYKYFQAWRDMMHKDGCYYPRSHYVRQMQVRFYDNSGEKANKLISFELGGCWPMVYPKIEGSYDTSKPVVYSVSLNVDAIAYKIGYVPMPGTRKYENLSDGGILDRIKNAVVGNLTNQFTNSYTNVWF